MKVLFITGEYPPMRGGVADQVEGLAHALGDRDVSSTVLTSTAASGLRTQNGPVSVWPIITGWSFASWPRISQAVREAQADLVHIQYQTAAYAMSPAINLLPFWLRRSTHRPVVTTLHDLREPYLFPKASPIRSWVNRRLILDSDCVIVTNGNDAFEVLRIQEKAGKGTKRPQLAIVPLIINSPPLVGPEFDRMSWRTKWGVAEGELLLGFFGFLNQSKGVDVILLALRQLLEVGVKARLMMIGEQVGASDITNIAYRDMILRMAHDLSLTESIIWTGYMPLADLSAALASLDICLLPYEDGASFRRNTLISALAHGIPVVTTVPKVEVAPAQFAALPWEGPTLVNRENCILVHPKSPEAIVEAVMNLVSSNSLCQRLGQGGRAIANAFSPQAAAEKTVQVYRSVLEGAAKAPIVSG
ncbi:MAG: glycosyl transferase, group 1 [Dehalococcoidia bacterium]|nr:glycosyl transferase, group 1 [Dehalococcoidia bacterium]